MIRYITTQFYYNIYKELQGYFVIHFPFYIGANWYFFAKVLVGTFFVIKLYLHLRSPP